MQIHVHIMKFICYLNVVLTWKFLKWTIISWHYQWNVHRFCYTIVAKEIAILCHATREKKLFHIPHSYLLFIIYWMKFLYLINSFFKRNIFFNWKHIFIRMLLPSFNFVCQMNNTFRMNIFSYTIKIYFYQIEIIYINVNNSYELSTIIFFSQKNPLRHIIYAKEYCTLSYHIQIKNDC